MKARAHDIRLASDRADHPETGEPEQQRLGLSDQDLDAAGELAEFHRLLAAELSPHSRIRGLVLRCGGHWSRLGAIPRNGLAEVERRDRA